MLRQSIRGRIQLWHTVLLISLVTAMLGTFFVYVRADRTRAVDEQLDAYLMLLLPRLFPPGPGRDFGRDGPPPHGRPPEDMMERPPQRPLETEMANSQVYYEAWSRRGDPLARSTNAPALKPPARGDWKKRRSFRTRDGARELVVFTPERDCIVIGASLAPVLAGLRHLALEEILVGLGLVVFGLAGGWWVARHALQPISEISAAAEQIAGGDRARRINLHETESELGQLAALLNRTFDRLDHAFAQQVQFTADASHELRTPVSVILTQAQLALSRERSALEYRESLGICQRAAERMRALINALLDLARMDASGFELTLEDCDLGRIAGEALALVAPLARQKRATVHSSVEPIHLKADGAKLGQVVVNLLQNALEHNAEGVEVRLVVQANPDCALLRVWDNGKGIPAEALPRLFDRFYRVDKSRSNSAGGSGLGLAICKAIVVAHGGTIHVESRPGVATEFRCHLPLASMGSGVVASP